NAVFQNDSSLTKVTLHEGLTNLSYRLFKSCVSLTEITIPSTVTKFGDYSLSECTNLTTIKVDKYSEAHAYFCTDSRLELTDNEPAQTKEQWMATAKYNILDNGILYVSANVKKINDYQYKNNQNITEIRFGETLERIGSYAFQGVKGLKKLVIPGNVKKIGDFAFAYCSSLEEVVIEEGVETVCQYAFYDCPKLISVTMPLSLQKVVPDGLYWQNKSTRVFHCYAGSEAYNLALKNNFELIDIIGVDEQKTDSIAKLVCTANKTIQTGMFQKVPAEIAILGDSITEIGENAFHAETKLQIKQNSYANKWAIENGYFIYNFEGEEILYTKDKSNSVAKQIDISPSASELTQFVDNVTIRVKRNTYADTWAKENGYYLCGVLADLNVYTKDASKQIEEDFTRFLCDDDSYANWTSYSFKVQEPLIIEKIDNNIVLTSFMLEPCENVTVSKNGKSIISNKTIQPLTHTVLCEADGTSIEDFMVTSNDSLYKKLTSLGDIIDWTVTFNGESIRKTEVVKGVPYLAMYPVYCREWIATICNHAYVIASEEYEEACFKAVEDKWLVTDEALTQFLTKEQMDTLLQKTRKHKFYLGRCGGGGLGSLGASGLWLLSGWFCNMGYNGGAFYHEFSHNMGYNHDDGNMCNQGVENGYGEKSWQLIGTRVFKQLFAEDKLPYTDTKLLNSETFSYSELHAPDPDEDVVKDSVLYIGDGAPRPDSHKNQTDFTKVEIPLSVSVIGNSAFYGTKIEEVELPSSVIKIKNYAFYNCANLKSITIPSSVREIGDNAFSNTGIDTIVIPESVTSVGKSVTSKGVVWKVKYGSAAYYAALTNNYPIVLEPEFDEENAAQIIAESQTAEAASVENWQKDDFTSSYVRRTWDFSSELKGAGSYTVTFKYTGGACMLCLADALFTADGNAIAFVAERRTAGLNPKQIVYEITVPAETEELMLFALARTDGGTDSKGTISISYQPSNNGENGNNNGDDNGNGNGDDNGNGNGDDNGNGNGDDNGNGNSDDNGN
ncbi:MAG: leucine-rich repeat protein, partial [Bacteroidales bacterium]|nr:leucine-rich repeat protein [Bacteroidales bacterium]